ncbi:tripartite tricarboxylate transporter TctB family protein [Halomonas sp. V046]|uniref:tripartite tricarboxylate transporter TctB family protein n=1 Tax=Halomonas sp. V046 TaxID=3459611 RepID=UPI004044D208
MNLSRLVFGLFAIGVAATFGITALGYPSAAAKMPLIYSVVVGLLGAGMIAQELVGGSRQRQQDAVVGKREVPPGVPEEGERVAASHPEPDASKRWKALVVFVLAAVYVASISWLGYVLATVAFMALSLTLVRHVTVRFSLIGIAGLVTVVCLVFIGFLGLPVPLLPPVF